MDTNSIVGPMDRLAATSTRHPMMDTPQFALTMNITSTNKRHVSESSGQPATPTLPPQAYECGRPENRTEVAS